MFLAIYIHILTKITFSINHMNLSKTKDLHISSMYDFFQLFKWIGYWNHLFYFPTKTKILHVYVLMFNKISFPIYIILTCLASKFFPVFYLDMIVKLKSPFLLAHESQQRPKIVWVLMFDKKSFLIYFILTLFPGKISSSNLRRYFNYNDFLCCPHKYNF